SCTDLQFLDRGRRHVAADVAHEESSGRSVVVGSERVPQAPCPYRVPVRPRPVVEGIVGWDGPVRVDPVDLASGTREILRQLRQEMLSGCEIQLAVVTECQRAAVVFSIGDVGFLEENTFAPLY